MLNLIQADLFKLRKSLAIKIIFGITTLSAVVMTVMAYLIPRGGIDVGMTGIGFMLSDVDMISILGAVIAGVFICGDFDNKTIHDAVSSGSGRGTIIISKVIVFFGAIVISLIPYAIATGIALGSGAEFSMGSVGVGFLNLMIQDSGKAFEASDFLKLLGIMVTLMIVYGSQLSICVPLAFAIKKPVFVIAIYYGITIFSAQLMALKGNSDLFDNIFAGTPFGGNYSFLTLDSGPADFVQAIFVSIVFMIAMIAVTYSVFRKAEIK